MREGAIISYGKSVLSHAVTALLTVMLVAVLFGDRLGLAAAAAAGPDSGSRSLTGPSLSRAGRSVEPGRPATESR